MARGSGMRIALTAVGQFHHVVLQTPVDIAIRAINLLRNRLSRD